MSFYGNMGDSVGTASKKAPSSGSGSGSKSKSTLLQTIQSLAKTRAATKGKKQEEKTKRKIGVDTIAAAAPELIDAGGQFLMDQGIIPQGVPVEDETPPEEGFMGMPYSTWAIISVGVLAAGGVGYWVWKKNRRA